MGEQQAQAQAREEMLTALVGGACSTIVPDGAEAEVGIPSYLANRAPPCETTSMASWDAHYYCLPGAPALAIHI